MHEMRKLGITIYPVHRMRVYNTGDAPGIGLDKRYNGLWQVNATSDRELLALEERLHEHFREARLRRCGNGNFTEWFKLSFEDLCAFMDSWDCVVRQLSIDEIREIHKKSEAPLRSRDVREYYDEHDLMEFQRQKRLEEDLFLQPEPQPEPKPPTLSLKEDFFSTFLGPTGTPRRIQDELWDKFEEICKSDAHYRGIVQWATGTGKTLALLMLFLLSAQKCKANGIVFRGLLIAPKNDIFDTIMHNIKKLSKWGITVCEGHNARLSSLAIPLDTPVLVTATHASLTDTEAWTALPPMTHCHYDEVHRITGTEFYGQLNDMLLQWGTQFLTGTSATPKTCNPTQHKKITELFGNPLQILHRCDVDEAITEGWIARPRFGVHVLPDTLSRATIIYAFVNTLRDSIQSKMRGGPAHWKGGKVIAYLPYRTEVREAVRLAKELMPPEWFLYTAVEDTDADADDRFITDEANGVPRILFACERYREGSDIKGLEITAILMGQTIGANILLQIAGRALRNDYDGKEGWCVIVRPSEEGTTEDDILDSIVLLIMEFIGKESGYTPSREKTRQTVTRFFGEFTISGKVYDVDETVHRIQAMYVRKEFERSQPKEKYAVVRALNKEMALESKADYYDNRSHHLKFIDDPKQYFKEMWVSWYHFLGVDTVLFPQTKAEWVRVCKEKDIGSWGSYKARADPSLPTNPGEMYDDYTNWDNEFGVEHGEYLW